MKTNLKKIVIPIVMHILSSQESAVGESPATACSSVPVASRISCYALQDIASKIESGGLDVDQATTELDIISRKLTDNDILWKQVSLLRSKLQKLQKSASSGKPESPYEFRPDGSRLRSTEEIVAAYTMAAAHGIHTGLFTLSFRDDLEGDDDYSYGYYESRRTSPATYLGLGTILGTLGSVGAVYAIDNWGDGFKYGVPMAAIQSYSLGTLGSILTLAAVDQTWGDAMSFKSAVRTTWLASSLSAVAGGWAASEFNIRPGQMAFIGGMGSWSTLLGMTFASSIVPYKKDGLNGMLWTGVGAYSLGLGISSYLVANGYSPSLAQVQYSALGGLIGSLMGASIGWLMWDRDDRGNGETHARISAATMGLTTVAGLGVGAYLARNLPGDTSPLTKSEAAQNKSSFEFAIMPTPKADGAEVQLSWKF